MDSHSSFKTIWRYRPFWVLSLAIFLGAYSYGMSAVSTTWLTRDSHWTLWHLLWAPIGLIVGILWGGLTVDHLGRIRLFRWTPIGYVIGSVILVVARNHFLASAGSLVLITTAGAESTIALVLGQELLPKPVRSTAFFLMMNFSNLGGFTLALLTTSHWAMLIRVLLTAGVPAILAALSWCLRRHLEEPGYRRHPIGTRSGQTSHFYRTPRFLLAVIFSYANAAGFSLATYALGVAVYPALFGRFLIFGTLGAFMAGLASPLFAKIPIERLLFGSNVTTFLIALGIAVASSIHWTLWTTLSIGTGIAFLAENEFKTNAWPSAVRGTAIAWERAGGQLGYLLTLLAVHNLSFSQLSWVLVGIWATGSVAAIIWLDISRNSHSLGIESSEDTP